MGFYQRLTGIEVNPKLVDMTLDLNKGMPGRVFAFYENPNAFGEVLLLLIPLSFALILCARSWYGKSLACLSTIMGCACLVMTYSRAGWVGLAVAALLFLFLWNKKLVPVVIVVALAGTLFLPETVSNRILSIFSSSDTSTNSRFPYYQAAWRFIKDQPLLGGGLGSDVVRDLIKRGEYFTGEDEFIHCHNIYLQIWCETGAIGLLTFLAGMFWTIRQGIRSVVRGICTRQTRLKPLTMTVTLGFTSKVKTVRLMPLTPAKAPMPMIRISMAAMATKRCQ
jgi:O-antigen ligase